MQKLKEAVLTTIFNKIFFWTFLTQAIFLSTIIYIVLNAQFVTKLIAFIFGIITIPILLALFIFQIWGMLSFEFTTIAEREKENGREESRTAE